MLPVLGALSSAMDVLQSLGTSKSSQSSNTSFDQVAALLDQTGGGSTSAGSNANSGSGWGSQVSPETMQALLAVQGGGSTAPTSPDAALKDLFSQIDANGDGQISKSEFENALGAGGTNLAQADSVFSQLDANGDGTVSLSELSNALQGAGNQGAGHHHHHHHVASSGNSSGAGDSSGGSGSGGSSSDPLLQALQGASTTSITNGDGSTTTTVTYADGSKVTMTTPASSTGPGSASSTYNFVEQMIQREAQTIASSTAAPLSLSA